jgi:hypothetical protein
MNTHINNGILVTRGVVGHSPGHSLSIGGILITILLASLFTYNIVSISIILCNVVAVFFVFRGNVYNINYDECTVIKSTYIFFYQKHSLKVDPAKITLKVRENWTNSKTFRLSLVDSRGDQHEIQRSKSDQLEELGTEIAQGLDIEFVIDDAS